VKPKKASVDDWDEFEGNPAQIPFNSPKANVPSPAAQRAPVLGASDSLAGKNSWMSNALSFLPLPEFLKGFEMEVPFMFHPLY